MIVQTTSWNKIHTQLRVPSRQGGLLRRWNIIITFPLCYNKTFNALMCSTSVVFASQTETIEQTRRAWMWHQAEDYLPILMHVFHKYFKQTHVGIISHPNSLLWFLSLSDKNRPHLSLCLFASVYCLSLYLSHVSIAGASPFFICCSLKTQRIIWGMNPKGKIKNDNKAQKPRCKQTTLFI